MNSRGSGSGGGGSGSGKWGHDFFERGGPITTQVDPATLRNAFSAGNTRWFGDAAAVNRTGFNGGTSVNVRHRSGSLTEFHMHGVHFGSIRHTDRNGDAVEVRPLNQDANLQRATTILHGMSDDRLSRLPQRRGG